MRSSPGPRHRCASCAGGSATNRSARAVGAITSSRSSAGPWKRSSAPSSDGYGFHRMRYFSAARNALALSLACIAFNLRRWHACAYPIDHRHRPKPLSPPRTQPHQPHKRRRNPGSETIPPTAQRSQERRFLVPSSICLHPERTRVSARLEDAGCFCSLDHSRAPVLASGPSEVPAMSDDGS